MALFSLSKTVLQKNHNLILNLARAKEKLGSFEEALNILEQLSKTAYDYNYIDEFSDVAIENLIFDISFKLEKTNSNLSSEENKVVFFDSFAYDLRGYTQQYLYALWDLGYKILFIRSNNSGLTFSNHLLSEIESHPNSEIIILDSSNSYVENLHLAKRKIEEFNPSKCFLHISPWDIMALLVFHHFPNITKYQIDFTDHAFWLGKKITDKLITFRDFGSNLSAVYRRIDKEKIFKIRPYPIYTKKNNFRGLPINKNNFIVGFSGGATYKIIDPSNTFLNLIKDILNKHKNFIFLFAYTGEDKFIKSFIKDNNLEERFILLGNRDDIQYIFDNIDLYINTFPYGGGNMILYAAAAKKPILSLVDIKLVHTHLHNVIDISGDESYEAYNENDFLGYADILINNKDERKEYAEILHSAINNRDMFTSSLKNLLQGKSASAKVENSFSLDIDYLCQTHINFHRSDIRNYYKSLRKIGFFNIAKNSTSSLIPAFYYHFITKKLKSKRKA